MLECIGRPCLSVPVSSVYTHVPPIQSAFSKTNGSNKSGLADRYRAAHNPAAPAPITATLFIFQGRKVKNNFDDLNDTAVSSVNKCNIIMIIIYLELS